MNLTAFTIKNKKTSYFVTGLLFLAGIAAFTNLGQLEDPEFSIKTAVVITPYPGASPKEVQLEVTDLLEKAIQEIPQLDYVESDSRAGLSAIKVEIKAEFWADKLPQIWDELRRKVEDSLEKLPPGAGPPIVNDSFGDVYGHVLAITGDGFTYAELEDYADDVLRKELNTVEGVARVELWGVQDKVIYADVSETQLSQLGITEADIVATLKQQNVVVDAGSVDLQDRRIRITPTGEFQSPEDIADLAIRPSLADTLINLLQNKSIDSSELIRIRHIANVRRGYREPPSTLMRYNGVPSIGISLSNISGVNIVTMGKAVDAKLKELEQVLPIGIEVHRVHWQSDIVNTSVKGFFINLAEAVAIVLVVLALTMGWRMGVIIGTALIMTIIVTFVLMALFGIDLQRMSLGALVIALGMMVDNSIVVADGILVRLNQGMERTKAAIEAASLPSIPLLGATVIAVMAFYPIFASTESAGEYCRTLFTVVAISLLSSWLISITLTPIQCMDMLPTPEGSDSGEDPYSGKFYLGFKNILHRAIQMRWLTIGGMIGLLLISFYGFGFVTQLFFPDSSMKKFMIDYWAPQGTRIQTVSENLKALEQKLLDDERVDDISSFVGAGPPRFYLPVEPEGNNASYAQIIVNMHDRKEIDSLIAEFTPWLADQYPDAIVPMRKYGVGPSNTWKFEYRISGPARVDPGELRSIANEGFNILEHEPLAGFYQTDWRQRTQAIEPKYNQERARWSAITRMDIANTTKRAYDGRIIGLYRERDDLIPIVMRNIEEERQNVAALDVLQLQGSLSTESLPISQVVDDILPIWEDPILIRRNRRPTITIQANPIPGITLPSLVRNVGEKFEAIKTPPGFTLEWGAEKEDSADSQASLIPGVIPALALMAVIIVALFNAYKPPLVILFTIPFVWIGLTWGLLISGAAFGFVALLGAMSLVGMMIKNAIVLLDQVNLNLEEGAEPYPALIDAAVSRLRPVVLAAATTVLGVIPLLQDVFWVGMAVVIMAGLTFGTILTMIMVPVFYATLFRLSAPKTVS